MSRRSPDDRLSEFESRLNRLKDGQSGKAAASDTAKTSGYGMAFTISADLVGGLVGGAGLGWLIDQWAGSFPLGMIVFFFLGAGAGMWNVFRTVRGYDMALGFRPPAASSTEPGDKTQEPTGSRSEKEGGDHRGQSTPSVPGRYDRPDPHRQR
ncbi:MAG: AtpZ/AtpI family protein [Rhodospirillales bacterium]|nr:AtpZ/AtpI family protein [Rhodospirillales bacterium]